MKYCLIVICESCSSMAISSAGGLVTTHHAWLLVGWFICNGRYHLCWALSRWARPTVIGLFFFRGSLVARWEAPGGFGASSGLWLANFSFSTLMLLVGSFDL